MDRLHVAKEIMVTKLVTLEPKTPVSTGISRLLEHNITGAPVVSPGWKYEGVFSEKCCMELLTGEESGLRSLRAADVMAPALVQRWIPLTRFGSSWIDEYPALQPSAQKVDYLRFCAKELVCSVKFDFHLILCKK